MARRAMPRIAVVADIGHSLWKVGVRDLEGNWRFNVAPHALHKIPQRKWEQIVERSRNQANAVDYVHEGRNYYIIGESAERFGHATRLMGAARYDHAYIGVQTLSMVARTTELDEAEIVLLALHPPSDAEYTRELRRAVKGSWDIELGNGKTCLYNVSEVITLDEPVAGLFNVALDDQLRENKRITGSEVLVLDIGGGTTSVAPVLPGGSVDYGRIDSYPMGILNVISKLQKNLMNQYRDMFIKTRQINQDRLRDSLLSEKFTGGGRTVTCKDEVRAAKAELLAEVERMYQDGAIGGSYGFDAVIMTGGGSVAMGQDLRDMLNHKSIHLATDNPADIHLANALGAAKLFDVLEADGKVDV